MSKFVRVSVLGGPLPGHTHTLALARARALALALALTLPLTRRASSWTSSYPRSTTRASAASRISGTTPHPRPNPNPGPKP